MFSTWASLERSPEWTNAVLERRKITEGLVGVGTRYHAVDQWPGRKVEFTVEVTGYEPNRRMSASWSEPMTGNWEARFEPTDTGTRLEFTTEVNPTGFMGLMAPLMKGWARRATEKFLAAFKDSVESATSDI